MELVRGLTWGRGTADLCRPWPRPDRDIRLRLVGGLAVSRSGQALPAKEVGSRKARLLLALLAVDRGRLVTVDRIVDVLWGDRVPRRPAENVATLVSRLRGVLGRPAVLGGRAGYRLGELVRVDLSDAAELVAEAEARLAGGEPASALAAARPAVEMLAGGEVLADEPDAPWAEPARATHGMLLRRARHTAAEAALRIGDSQAARAAAETAAAADPMDEVAHRTLMRAHVAAGEPARALAVYERLRVTLAGELGVDPASPTRELHLAILRGSLNRRPARPDRDPPRTVLSLHGTR